MQRVLSLVTPALPEHKPRYLMGVGFPRDIVEAVKHGVDMFDCVMPTRNGRNAYAFTASGAIRLRNSRFANDPGSHRGRLRLLRLSHVERGAIRHFFFAGEMLGPILLSLHNIRFYQRLMADIRRAIAEGRYGDFAVRDPRASLGPAEDETQNIGPQDDRT
jgi:queuine tRNA-ribosyltransferase